MQGSQRSVELDVLRFLAIALVLVRHFAFLDHGVPDSLRPILEIGIRGGWIGVDLFFVLSGFLISGLLFREYQQHARIDFKRFFIRRGFKIYPAYYFLIAVTVLLKLLRGSDLSWTRVLQECLFLQNYGIPLWDHTWSLAIEEHFYVALPLLLIGLSLRPRAGEEPFRGLPAIYLSLALCLLGLRIAAAWKEPFSYLHHLFPTHLRIDSLMCGVIVSYGYHFHHASLGQWVRKWRRWLYLLIPLSIAPAFTLELEKSSLIYTAGYLLLQLGFGGLVALVMVMGLPGIAISKPFLRLAAWAGAFSYSIYLWHIPVVHVAAGLMNRGLLSWWWAAPLYLFVSIGVGVVMAKIIEIPTLQLRDRLFPSRSKTLVPPKSARKKTC